MIRSYITIRYRLRGYNDMYLFLNQLAGTNRYLWNNCLADLQKQYQETKKTKHAFFDLCKWYTSHKQEVDWLKDYPVSLTRTGLQNLIHAYKSFLQGKRDYPNFKAKHQAKKSFAVALTKSHFSKEGHFQLKRGLYAKLLGTKQLTRYANPIPKSGRIFEGRKEKWYLTVQYEVDSITRQAHRAPIGIDRNVGQCYGSNGIKYKLRDLKSFQTRLKCLQKWRAKKVKGSHRYNKLSFTIAKYYAKIKHIRNNELRHIAKEIAWQSDLVYLEDLKTKNLTKNSSGTVDNPGKNVSQKSGLNRVILDSGWYKLEQFLKEQAVVYKVDPKYTIQKCSECGYTSKENRTSQSKFRCMPCELELNSDFNAALNILASGVGTIKTERREYNVPLTRASYSVKRQNNTSAF